MNSRFESLKVKVEEMNACLDISDNGRFLNLRAEVNLTLNELLSDHKFMLGLSTLQLMHFLGWCGSFRPCPPHGVLSAMSSLVNKAISVRPVYLKISDVESGQGVTISCWANGADQCFVDSGCTIPVSDLDMEFAGLEVSKSITPRDVMVTLSVHK